MVIKLFFQEPPLLRIIVLLAGQEVMQTSSQKIAIVEEECDETLFWLELIIEGKLLKIKELKDIIKEADELTAIFTATGKTAKKNNPKSQIRNPKS